MCVFFFLNSASWGAIPSACFVRCTCALKYNNNNNNIETENDCRELAVFVSSISEPVLNYPKLQFTTESGLSTCLVTIGSFCACYDSSVTDNIVQRPFPWLVRSAWDQGRMIYCIPQDTPRHSTNVRWYMRWKDERESSSSLSSHSRVLVST